MREIVDLDKHRPLVYAGSLAQPVGNGGLTWLHLQFLLGFRRLGWDVLFLDRLEPEMCGIEAGPARSLEESPHAAYFLKVMQEFGLNDAFSLSCNRGRHTIGLSRNEVLKRVAE